MKCQRTIFASKVHRCFILEPPHLCILRQPALLENRAAAHFKGFKRVDQRIECSLSHSSVCPLISPRSAECASSAVVSQHLPHRHQADVASIVLAAQPRSCHTLPHRVQHLGSGWDRMTLTASESTRLGDLIQEMLPLNLMYVSFEWVIPLKKKKKKKQTFCFLFWVLNHFLWESGSPESTGRWSSLPKEPIWHQLVLHSLYIDLWVCVCCVFQQWTVYSQLKLGVMRLNSR